MLGCPANTFQFEFLNIKVTDSPGAFKITDVCPLKLEGVIVTFSVPDVETFIIVLI